MQALPGALLEAMYGSMFSGVSILKNAFGIFVMGPLAMGRSAPLRRSRRARNR